MSECLTDTVKGLILNAYLDGTQAALPQIAARYNVALSACQSEWQSLQNITTAFHALPQITPPTHIQNQILLYAESQLLSEKTNAWAHVVTRFQAWRCAAKFFAALTLHPRYATFATVMVVALSVFAFNHRAQEVAQSATLDFAARARGLQTTLDFHQPAPFFTPRRPSLIAPVSLGDNPARLNDDTELDQKIMARALSDKDVDMLFFRARKFEHLGYYSQALQDYQYIAQFYPSYENRKTVELAIASCLEGLKQKPQAIGVLQNFETQYGSSEEINMWIDELKSETF